MKNDLKLFCIQGRKHLEAAVEIMPQGHNYRYSLDSFKKCKIYVMYSGGEFF